jgi:hypothetical protein
MQNSIHTFVGFEILTVMAVKSSLIWDITPCSQVKIYRRFVGIYRLDLQGRGVSRARNHHEAGSKEWLTCSCWFLSWQSCFRILSQNRQSVKTGQEPQQRCAVWLDTIRTGKCSVYVTVAHVFAKPFHYFSFVLSLTFILS